MPDFGAVRPCILLAEDEAITGLELADSLEREGFAVAGPFATCSDAEHWLKSNEPSAAILDNSLKDGPCDALASDLRDRGVPFVIYSGHSRTADLPDVFQDARWIVKPIRTEALLQVLRSCLNGPRTPPSARPT